MDEVETKVLGIVDDDIAVLFSGKPGSFALGLPIDMQIARSLKKIVVLMTAKEVQGGDDCTNDGG